jgi:hypothetical protein
METLESVTKVFEAQFMQNKLDGLLKCMELERIKKYAQLKVKTNLCKKICICKDNCRTYCTKRKLASRNG